MSNAAEEEQKYLRRDESVSPPVTLDDEMGHAADHLPDSDIWEETAVCLVAETETHDVLLWNAGYILKGGARAIYTTKDGVEHDILFIAVPKEQRGKMSDNNFVRAGWYGTGHFPASDLKIERYADRVVWQVQDEQFIARPPIWQVKGQHGGVELDLTYTMTGKAVWNWGAWSQAKRTNRAGYDAFASVDGTIQSGGHYFAIKNGYGVREHISVSNNDVIALVAPPRVMWWLYLVKDDVAINYFTPATVEIGKVDVGGREIYYTPGNGKGSISYKTLEYWPDPRTGINLPVRWHLNMSSPEAIVDLEISAHGRGNFIQTFKNGVHDYCYMVCVSNGFYYEPATGRKVLFKDHITCNSYKRTIAVARETINGPVFTD